MILGGAIYEDEEGQKQWRSSNKKFLFPSRAMSKYFGKTVLTLLENTFCNNELVLKGGISGVAESTTRGQLMLFR